MKTMLKVLGIAVTAVLIYSLDIAPRSQGWIPGIQFIAEAQAVYGTHRRTRRRSVAVGYTAGASSAEAQQQAAAQSQQQATAQQQTTAQEQGTSGQQAAGNTASSSGSSTLPEGSIVTTLPPGCEPVTSGGVQYQHCGDDYFRTAFQGDQVVYVSSRPE